MSEDGQGAAQDASTAHQLPGTRQHPSDEETVHGYLPLIPFRKRDGRGQWANYPYTIVDISAFEDKEDSENFDDTYDSDDSREPLIGTQSEFTTDDSDEEEDVSGYTTETDEDFLTDESVTSLLSSEESPERRTPDVFVSSWDERNTSQIYTTTTNYSSEVSDDSDANHRRNRNINAREPRKSFRASDQEPLLIKDETGSKHRQRSKSGLTSLSRSKSGRKSGRSRSRTDDTISDVESETGESSVSFIEGSKSEWNSKENTNKSNSKNEDAKSTDAESAKSGSKSETSKSEKDEKSTDGEPDKNGGASETSTEQGKVLDKSDNRSTDNQSNDETSGDGGKSGNKSFKRKSKDIFRSMRRSKSRGPLISFSKGSSPSSKSPESKDATTTDGGESEGGEQKKEDDEKDDQEKKKEEKGGEKTGEKKEKKTEKKEKKTGEKRESKKGDKSRGRRESRKRRKGSPKKKNREKKIVAKKGASKDPAFSLFFKQKEYPISIYFILGSELCERFTYFGLRTILVLYLTNWLHLAQNQATAVFHLFSSMAYFSPIFGAILADSYIGRYKTILYISIVYTIGCILLALTAFPPPEIIGPFIGLFLISIGTGGIKPCVVTFGGDQFERNQVRHKASFFSTFYFVINMGSLISTIVTPLLRSDVQCVENSCYPLAFGVPAILMTLALIVFYAGSRSYKHVPPTGSLFTKTIRCLVYASGGGSKTETKGGDKKDKKKKGDKKGQKKKEEEKDKDKEGKNKHKEKKRKGKNENKNDNKSQEKEKKGKQGKSKKEEENEQEKTIELEGSSWINAATDIFNPDFVKEVQILTRLIWLFLPLPMFWALFNQQGSRWTLQAAQLDGRFSFLGSMKPEQMQALNPLLIVLLIPVFERVIYPCMKSCRVPHKPLQRMVIGMLFGALAFVFAALLQMKIEGSLEKPLEKGKSGYTIFNTIDCKLHVQGSPPPFYQGSVPPFGQTTHWEVASGKKTVSVFCPTSGLSVSAEADLEAGKAFRLVVTAQPGILRILVLEENREKSTNGTAFVSFLHLLHWVASANIKISSTRDEVQSVIMKVGLENATSFHVFEPGSYQLSFPTFSAANRQELTNSEWTEVGKPIEVGSGGIYTVALIDPSNSFDFDDVVVEMYVDVKENSLSMVLMVPQYIAITVGEILFSISGLAFAYTQSPESMKSIIQALWLLTTSMGDIIVVIVAEAGVVSDQIGEFWLFAGLMVADTIIFAVMTCFYTNVDEKRLKGKKSKKDQNKKKGKRGASKRGRSHRGNRNKGGKKRQSSRGKRGGSRAQKGRRGKESKGDEKEESKDEENQENDDDKNKKRQSRRGSRSRRSRRGSKGGGSDDDGRSRRKSRSRQGGEDGGDKRRSRRGSEDGRGSEAGGEKKPTKQETREPQQAKTGQQIRQQTEEGKR